MNRTIFIRKHRLFVYCWLLFIIVNIKTILAVSSYQPYHLETEDDIYEAYHYGLITKDIRDHLLEQLLPSDTKHSNTINVKISAIKQHGFGRVSLKQNPHYSWYSKMQLLHKRKYLLIKTGILLTARDSTNVSYHEPYIYVTSPTHKVLLEHYYVSGETKHIMVIMGSYQANIGHGLNYSTTSQHVPDNFVEHLQTYRSPSSFKKMKSPVGIVLSFKQQITHLGALKISLFSSFHKEDLYQYDFSYKQSLPVYYINTTTPASYVTLPNFIREKIAGSTIQLTTKNQLLLGLVAYGAHWELPQYTTPSQFTYSALYPTNGKTYCLGTYLQYSCTICTLKGALSFQPSGAMAAYMALNVMGKQAWHILWHLRYYSPQYENPYSKTDAASDQVLGLRTRNELGSSVQITYTPLPLLSLLAGIDIWTHPHHIVYANNTPLQIASEPFLWDMAAYQKINLQLPYNTHISLWVTYHNKDLTRNSRTESFSSYQSADQHIHWEGHGSKIQLGITVTNKALKVLKINGFIRTTMVDTNTFNKKYEQQCYLQTLYLGSKFDCQAHFDTSMLSKLALQLILHKNLILQTHIIYWKHYFKHWNDSLLPVESDRTYPQIAWFSSLSVSISKYATMKLSYGYQYYLDHQYDSHSLAYKRYAQYHFLHATLEVDFPY